MKIGTFDRKEHLVVVDVDDTLILWDGKHNSPGEGKHIVQQKVSDGTTAEFLQCHAPYLWSQKRRN